MPDSAETSFADFVAREHGGLQQLAVLLEDDRSDAEDLLGGVLATVRGRWRRLARRGAALREAQRLLVRRVLRRSTDGPRTSGWVDDPYAGWDADRHDDLRRALSALPTATRAAVVLSVWAGLPDRDVADVLRTPEDTVRGEVVTGLAPLRAALAPVATPWQPGTGLPDGDDVRAELTALADDGAPGDPVGAAAAAERTAASRRHRRWPVAVAATAAAVVVAVPALTGEDAAHPGPETGRGGARPPAEPRHVDVSDLPTRGSLADDTDFLDALVAQPWASELTDQHPVDLGIDEGTRRVLFAGDVASGRWALVAARAKQVDPTQEGISDPFLPGGLYMAWFTGPRGAAPGDMVMSTFPSPLAPDQTPSLLDPRSGTLVVVGAPGDRVEVSERVEVDADGTDSRRWRTAATTRDGITETRVHPLDLPWTWAVNYRTHRGDHVSSGAPDGLATSFLDGALPDLGVRYPAGPPPDGAGRRAARWAAFIALSSLGAPADGTDVRARVVQPVPGGEGSVALVTITLPSGAYLVSAQWAWDVTEQFPGSADCGIDVRAAAPPPEERLLVARCEMFDPAEGMPLGEVLVASTPPGVALLRFYRGNGTYLEQHEVHGTTLVLPMPAGTASVEAVTADGVLLGRSELLGHWQPATD